MKPYEEVCFPSGILRWTRENNLYVCRLTEDQMNEIKEIHETPYTKTYSSGKPNYTQPIKREPTIDGWPLYSGLPDWTSVEGTKREYGEGMVEKKVAITQDETVSIVCHESVAQYAQVNGLQKKEWVGLTDEEIKDILDCGRPDLVNIKKVEQKLKEKNT